MIYIGFLAYIFEPSAIKLDETAIIDMMAIVAPILPLLLVAAALSAQFSAAIADTSGAGGLFTEVSKGKLKPNQSYALLVIIGIALTWSANIFEIISYASRAFVYYYVRCFRLLGGQEEALAKSITIIERHARWLFGFHGSFI
jgi:hypothetical protein